MTRLLVALLAVGFLFAACGSGDAPQPTETATTERAEREATVSQQQDQQVVAEEAVEEQVEEQVEVEQAASEAQVDELPVDAVGVHKGVRSQRNMLGEPDAPVLIEHFGDFT